MTEDEMIAAACEYAQNKRIGGTAIRVFMDGIKWCIEHLKKQEA